MDSQTDNADNPPPPPPHTQICFFFNYGRCLRGHDCPYSHMPAASIGKELYKKERDAYTGGPGGNGGGSNGGSGWLLTYV